MVNVAEELFEGADNERFLGWREMAKVGETVAFEVIGCTATLV